MVAPGLATYHPSAQGPGPCQVIVDTGYAFTHIVPCYNHVPLNYAIKRYPLNHHHPQLPNFPFRIVPFGCCRIQVGGKILTNYLKEVISYRQWNMMEETFLVNDVKETTCFVSDNPERDLDTCR